jgi:hypothetical protein
MARMASREMAGWLEHYFPAIEPASWGDDRCWIAFMKTREPEHNPPFYWLGRALDAVDEGDAGAVFRARLEAAHGVTSCGGDFERDQRAQDVLSEACAYAWAAAQLGPPVVETAEAGASLERDAVRLHVPAHDAYIAPVRLWPVQTLTDVVRQIAARAEEAGRRLPRSPGRVLYVDAWHEQMYAQNLGYRLELTEPLQDALRLYAVEHGLGHVLTRPFEWGRPVEAWY